MADLETAGTDLLEKIKELMKDFPSAQKAFEECEEKLDKAKNDVEEDFDDIDSKVEAFLDQLNNDRSDNQSEVQDTKEAVNELKAKVLESAQEAKDRMDSAKEEITEFAEEAVEALEPKVQQVMAKVHQASRNLKARAGEIEDQVESISSSVSDFLNDEICNAFKDFQSEVTDRAATVAEYIAGEVTDMMSQNASDLGDKLTEFTDDLQTKMSETGDTAMQSAEEALTQCFQQHKEMFDTILNLGEQLKGVLEMVSKGVEQGGEIVGQCNEAVQMGVDTTAVGVNSVIETIEKVFQVFEDLGF